MVPSKHEHQEEANPKQAGGEGHILEVLTEGLDPVMAEAPLTLTFGGNNPIYFVSARSPFMSGLGHFATETS